MSAVVDAFRIADHPKTGKPYGSQHRYADASRMVGVNHASVNGTPTPTIR
jgi:hypothetical protein